VRIAFAGGGTGGHLFPGLAVAEAASRSGFAESIVFFGAARGIESRVIPRTGYDLVLQPLEGLRGSSPTAAARSLWLLARAVTGARRELRRRRVDVVVGLGGYASTAAVVAAVLSRIPVVLLEQNREPGLANGLFARVAAAVCTSFADTAEALPRSRGHWTGNPVRAEMEDAFAARAKSRDSLLIFGGSAGAMSINRAVLSALGKLRAAAVVSLPSRILHQAGAHGIDEVRAGYAALALDAEVHEFIEDMASAYAAARIAVCRAGATTVAELTATGTPAILIPFPHAAAHQLANARALEREGAAIVIPDDSQTAERLAGELGRLLASPERLDSMAAAAARLGRPGAARRVVEVIDQVVAASSRARHGARS
jgi:UDP-N-acetylglucosamine--N-acetylmuramyl-(pentapeptide) pyrophosphoryl-undecaprenol N-acetylglucosamine transferase